MAMAMASPLTDGPEGTLRKYKTEVNSYLKRFQGRRPVHGSDVLFFCKDLYETQKKAY